MVCLQDVTTCSHRYGIKAVAHSRAISITAKDPTGLSSVKRPLLCSCSWGRDRGLCQLMALVVGLVNLAGIRLYRTASIIMGPINECPEIKEWPRTGIQASGATLATLPLPAPLQRNLVLGGFETCIDTWCTQCKTSSVARLQARGSESGQKC